MFGISFFGVTPGFSQKDFCSDETLLPIIRACSELYTLDQFTVKLPAGGTLRVFSGQMAGEHRISFIAQYRHAIEYGGNRDGGHYGVGIWLVDSWIDSAVLSLLNRTIDFLRHELINAEGRFFRTFEQVDWDKSPVRSYLDELNKYRIALPPIEEDITPHQGARKLLLVDKIDTIESSSASLQLESVIGFFGQYWGTLCNRVIYQSFDSNVIKAIRQLSRLELTTLNKLATQYQTRLARTASNIPTSRQQSDSQLQVPGVDAGSISSMPTTIPVRDYYSQTPTRSPAKPTSGTRQADAVTSGRKRSAGFLAKLEYLGRFISDVCNQVLTLCRENVFSIVAAIILVLIAAPFLLLPSAENPILNHAFTKRQNNSRNSSVTTSEKKPSTVETPNPTEGQPTSNAIPPGAEGPCLRTNDPSLPEEVERRKKIQDLERIQRLLEKNDMDLKKSDLELITTLIKRARASLRCPELK
jgi:hypothetical protein